MEQTYTVDFIEGFEQKTTSLNFGNNGFNVIALLRLLNTHFCFRNGVLSEVGCVNKNQSYLGYLKHYSITFLVKTIITKQQIKYDPQVTGTKTRLLPCTKACAVLMQGRWCLGGYRIQFVNVFGTYMVWTLWYCLGVFHLSMTPGLS